MLKKNLVGKTFGRLTVVKRILKPGGSQKWWLCRCSCGGSARATTSTLNSQHTQSCGCLRLERALEANTKHGHKRKSGQTPEYQLWCNIKLRCSNPNDSSYKNYGERGIKVCKRWRTSFEAFLADVGPRPSLKHSIDRYPDNDGDYEPGNVRWATRREQSRNTRRTRLITFNMETLCLKDWAKKIDIAPAALRRRLRNWPLARALTDPPGPQRGY